MAQFGSATWLGAIGALLIACSGGTPSGGDSGATMEAGSDDGGTEAAAKNCTAATCAGCCLNDVCQPGNTQIACGKAGAVCATCSSARVCATLTQACELDPNAMWKVQPTSAVISTKNQGSDWDVGGGAPDPFVELWCPSTSATSTKTATVSDSFSPTWTTGGCAMKAKDLTSSGFAIAVWDEDISVNDGISAKGTIVPKESDLVAGSMVLTAMPTLTSLNVALQKQ